MSKKAGTVLRQAQDGESFDFAQDREPVERQSRTMTGPTRIEGGLQLRATCPVEYDDFS